MSHSRRKSPFVGVTAAPSAAEDKRRANKRLRRVAKVRVQVNPEEELPAKLKEVSDIWTTAKEGKIRISPGDRVRMRK
ncbi:MAG: hypothetical protein K1X42_06120 [Opitutaceae bacterium]|nr:hypothetical protein [Opitutaceae bacterium]